MSASGTNPQNLKNRLADLVLQKQISNVIADHKNSVLRKTLTIMILGLGLCGVLGVILVMSSYSGRLRSEEIHSQMAQAQVPPANQNFQPQGGATGFNPQSMNKGNSLGFAGAPAATNETGILAEPTGLQKTDFMYDPTGLRDPFKPFFSNKLPSPSMIAPIPGAAVAQPGVIKPPVEVIPENPLEAFDLAQLKVVAIILSSKNSKVVIKDPTGKLHYLKTNSRMGRSQGQISEIKEGGIVVVERFMEGAGAAVNKTFIPVSK